MLAIVFCFFAPRTFRGDEPFDLLALAIVAAAAVDADCVEV